MSGYPEVPRYQVPARRGQVPSTASFDDMSLASSSTWRRSAYETPSSADPMRAPPPAYSSRSLTHLREEDSVPVYPQPRYKHKYTDDPTPYNKAYPHPLSLYASPAVNPHALVGTTYERDLMHLLETDPDLVKGTILASCTRAAVPIPGLHLVGLDDEGNPMGCGIPERIYSRFESYGAARLPVTTANPAAEASSHLSPPAPAPRLGPRFDGPDRRLWAEGDAREAFDVPSVRIASGEDHGRRFSHSSSAASFEFTSTPQDAALESPWHKTEVCRSFEEHGDCKYGLQCQFAHGAHELRPATVFPGPVLPARLTSLDHPPTTATALSGLATAAMARKNSVPGGAAPLPGAAASFRYLESRRASVPPTNLDVVEEDEYDSLSLFPRSPVSSQKSSQSGSRPPLVRDSTLQVIPKLDVRIEHRRSSPDSAASLSAHSQGGVGSERVYSTSPSRQSTAVTPTHLRAQSSASSLSNSVSSHFSAPTFPTFTPFSSAQAHARAQTSAIPSKPSSVRQSTLDSSIMTSPSSATSAHLVLPSTALTTSQPGWAVGSSPPSSSSYDVGPGRWSSAITLDSSYAQDREVKHRSSHANLSAACSSDDGSSTSLDFTTGKSIWS